MKHGLISSGPTPNLPAFSNYVQSCRGLAPTEGVDIDWTIEIDGWPLLANDTIGDCSLAGYLHYIQAAIRWRDGTAPQPRTEDALQAYRMFGWNGVGEGNGVVLADLMQRWKTVGLPWLGGVDKIHNFVRVEKEHVQEAIRYFGPLITGSLLPLSANDPELVKFAAPTNLLGINRPGSWSPHCMLLAEMKSNGDGAFITWGGKIPADAGWIDAYTDEFWAVLHPIWLGSSVAPGGLVSALAEGKLSELLAS